MDIRVKGCRLCPFLFIEQGSGVYYYTCSRGTFNGYTEKPSSKEVHPECPLKEEAMTIKLAVSIEIK